LETLSSPKVIIMLRMIEVVETSNESYSDAVKKAIESLVESGEKVHFFKVIEPRGALKNGKIEYQVVISVAVE
jgi:flavin-binding protein dodecin